MESPGPLLAGPGEKAGPVALCPQAGHRTGRAAGYQWAFIEQTLSVGLEVPSQQMDLDRRIQMQGLSLVQTTDTSVDRSQGALVAEGGETHIVQQIDKGSAGFVLFSFSGVCVHTCVYMCSRAYVCLCVHGCVCMCICVDGPVCMCSKRLGEECGVTCVLEC